MGCDAGPAQIGDEGGGIIAIVRAGLSRPLLLKGISLGVCERSGKCHCTVIEKQPNEPRHVPVAAAALAGALFAPADGARGQGADAVSAITETLRSYEAALNASDTDAVMVLYTEDGVFMPQHFPSAVGVEQVRAAYNGVFATIKLDVVFDIVEVVPLADDWAFARTNSAGAVKVLASGDGGPEANQELFVLKRVNGDWKIARYAFSTTNPPRG